MNRSSIFKMVSFIDGLLRLVLFLGTFLLMTVFIWGAREKHHLGHSGILDVLSSFPPIAICLLGLLGSFYKNQFWLKLYAVAMVLMALGYTIFMISIHKNISTSVSAFILFHYILAYLAHYLAKTIEEQKSHNSTMRSYIRYNRQEHLLPLTTQQTPNHNNTTSHYLQNPYYINPALEPPPSYNSVSSSLTVTTNDIPRQSQPNNPR